MQSRYFPELEALVPAARELELIERFEADGKTSDANHYLLWRKQPPC